MLFRGVVAAALVSSLAAVGNPLGAGPVCGGSVLSFGPTLNYGADRGSEDVAVGDFDGDGAADLAVANEDLSSNDVSILLNRGDGTFQPAVNYGVGVNPVSLAVGDFDGDGNLDLAVANFSEPAGRTISVLLGNGDGTFQPATFHSAGRDAHSVAVGDFDGDQRLDLAVSNYDFNTVSILIGNGNGTFQAPVSYGVGLTAAQLAPGDFNGDGKVDIVTANLDSNNVSVLMGRGNGTFQAAVSYPTGAGPYGVAVADLNGDHSLDLVTANLSGNSVSVLLGNGDGSFGSARNYGVGVNPGAVAVRRLDVDWVPDVVATNVNSQVVSVLRGNADGTLQPAVNHPTDLSPSGVAVADLNGDGKPDIAAANFVGTVSVLFNRSAPGALLDSFNRPDGALGPLWAGHTDGYGIVEQHVDVGSGGPVYWSSNPFGVNQEACVTFVAVDPDGPLQGVLLKVQQGDWRNGVVAISYDARRGKIIVATHEPGLGHTVDSARGIFNATLSAGDQLGARSLSNGTVQVYVNGLLVGKASVGAFFIDKSGAIGLAFANADRAMFDDFAGGTVAP